MKILKRILAVGLVALSVMAVALPAMAATTMYVNVPVGETVNIRASASTSAVVKFTLGRGYAVSATQDISGWHYVTVVDGRYGYVMTQYLSTTNPGGGTVPTGHPQTQADAFGSNTLVKGHINYYVKNVQICLGLYVDGNFGSGTESAVKTFQASKGLAQDGQVGANTKAALWAQYGAYLQSNGVMGM